MIKKIEYTYYNESYAQVCITIYMYKLEHNFYYTVHMPIKEFLQNGIPSNLRLGSGRKRVGCGT